MAARLLLLPCALLSALALCGPAHAWYKQAAAPGYRSVGRASGLLSGLRRSPFVPRAADEEPLPSWLPETQALPFGLKTTPACISNVVPKPLSCQPVFGHKTTFKCKADVFLSLDSADCARR